MEDTGKQKFEEAWREAMGDERVAPPEGVWTNIETQLDSESMKRRVIFYQRLAAASVLFAFLAGAFGFYWRDQSHAQLAQVQNAPSSPSAITENAAKEKSPAATNEGLTTETVSNPKSQSHSTSGNGEENTLTATDEKMKSTRQPVDPGTIASIPSQSTRTIGSMSEPAFASGYKLSAEQNKIADSGSVSEEIEAAPLFDIDLKGKPVVVELVRKLPAMPAAFLNREEKKYEEKWWASAGASAGGYNPNYSSPSVTPSISPMAGFGQLTMAAVPASTGTKYGTSYSVALSAAHRLSRKWVVQSGMQYMARSIDYTTNLTNYSGNAMSASLADYATLKSSAVSYSTPYQLQSRSEYISVPLQVGYLLVDRKFGWMLNSGVSSDIFLRNTLTDLSGQRSSYSEGAGDNSPYRTFMWSALMSTEFSYKMGSHYRLAVVPGLRYSLNPMLKDESTQGNPVIWDVGFRFRYIFK